MLTWFRRQRRLSETATELYGAVVARAREPHFYAVLGIPDTPEGRYEMIVMHLVQVLERLRAEGPGGVGLSRALIETFVADMDGAMREMGVGDLSVPKKVKSAAAGLYARADAFRQGVEGPDRAALGRAIGRLTLVAAEDDPRAAALAEYYRATWSAVRTLPASEVMDGRLAFPPLQAAAERAVAARVATERDDE